MTSNFRLVRLQCIVSFVILLHLFFGATLLRAQETTHALTLEDIWASAKFQGQAFQGGKWAEKGPVITFTEPDSQSSATHLIEYNLEREERRIVLDGNNLHAGDVDRLIQIEDYAFTNDDKKVLLYTESARVWRLRTKGYYYIYDFDKQTLTALSDREKGYQMFAKISPDGKRAAFVRERNLFLVDLQTMIETAFTSDGSEGQIINGTTDWVYEEELFLRDGWDWSPDSRYIAFLKLDESETNDFFMADLRGMAPELIKFRFPLAGQENSRIQVGVYDINSRKVNFFDTGTWEGNDERYEYIVRMGWTPKLEGKHRVWMIRMNRDQNVAELLYGDPESMSLSTIVTDTDEAWVEAFDQDATDRKVTFLNDKKHFVWRSEADGFNHLYLYRNGGQLVRQITKGNWKVTAFHGVDDKERAYFTATAESPTERHLYRMPLRPDNGASPTKITSESGWHDINMSSDCRYYIDTYSNHATPATTRLHRVDGHLVKILEDNAGLKETLAGYTLPTIEFLKVPGADDTELYAYIIKPSDFDRGKKYPLLIYTYGGPWAQSVADEWAGSFQLWHSYLVEELDIIVACVDNRGAAGYGKAFAAALYRKVGTVEPQDQIAAAKHWGSLPYIDADRIGIWGWSYGGYNTLLSMLKYEGPETIKLGVAVAPGIDWRLYDTIYTERYMSTPEKNKDGYEEASPANFADQMADRQRLLIVQGDLDDNVHFQQTVHMISALQKANKQFRFMVYPGGDHGMAGTGNPRVYLHLFTMITDFIRENL